MRISFDHMLCCFLFLSSSFSNYFQLLAMPIETLYISVAGGAPETHDDVTELQFIFEYWEERKRIVLKYK